MRETLLAFLALASLLQAEVRTFTSSAGTTLKGELVSIIGEAVTLKRENGQLLSLKISAFSQADQTWLKAQPTTSQEVASKATATKPSNNEARFAMVYDKPHTIDLVVCDSFELSGKLKDIQFAAPLPPNTSRQKLISAKVDKKSNKAVELSGLGRDVLVGTFEEQEPHKLSRRENVVITYRIELTPRKLVMLQPGQEPIPPPAENTDMFLRSDATMDWQNPDFLRWVKDQGLLRNPDESALYFGRRLYNHMRSKGEYKYDPSTWKASDFTKKSKTKFVGDCGAFSVVFVAACRANGIPGRMLSGRWAQDASSKAGLHAGEVKTHVYAEFYDPSVGWIPVDISSAVLYGSAKDPNYLFGTDPATDFVTMHFDADIVIPFQEGRQVETQWLLLPHASSNDTRQLISGSTHLMQVLPASQQPEN